MGENRHHFDLSDCRIPWLQDKTNKKKLGCFKDENEGLIIKEFLALNPKVYSLIHDKYDDKSHELKLDSNTKKLKGVSKAVAKKQMEHIEFVKVLEKNEPVQKKVASRRSFNHQVYTVVQKKTALTSYYDKMYMADDGITCYPFGYYKTK